MKPNTDKPKAPEPKPDAKDDAKPQAKDDLKTLPLAEVEKKLESSSGGAYSSRGAETSDAIRTQ